MNPFGTFFKIFQDGGLVMWPLLLLSFISVVIIFERLWFWSQILFKSAQVQSRILDTAARDWDLAAKVARDNKNYPIARYLLAPLRIPAADPEVFHLAMESAANEQLTLMRRGDKFLEAVIALSPLLGLLGTVLGLIRSMNGFQGRDLVATDDLTRGIGESLVATATGMIVAIIALAFYRLFQGFLFNQTRIFRKAGSELELIYRQRWLEEEERRYDPPQARNYSSPETSNLQPSGQFTDETSPV